MQIGFLGLLTLLFVAAKLFGAIDWSWWIVFSPMIIGAVIGALIWIIMFVVVLVSGPPKRKW